MADRKSEIREELKSLRDVIDTKNSRNQEIVDQIKGDGSEEHPLEVVEGMKAEFQENRKAIDEARDRLEMILETEEAKGFTDRLDAILEANDGPRGNRAAALAQAAQAGHGRKGIGQSFVESDEFKAMIQGGETKSKAFRLDGGFFERKDVYTDLPTGTPTQFGTPERDPIVPSAMRTVRVRDLFPSRQTTSNLIEFIRVSGFTNNASVVPERDADNSSGWGAKPQSSLAFVGDQASVRTIAHWEAAHRSALADEPVLRGIIDDELLYGLRLVEDDQILNGTGANQDLEGIRNVSGIQTYAWSSGAPTPVADNKADALRRAMTLALLAYYEPTGVVLHDSDWEDVELLKSEVEGLYLMAVNIAQGGEKRVWRAPAVTTPAMTEGVALVGAFGLGAQLYDREEATIRVSDSHANFFVENAVAILAEERLALATKRPEAFVEVTFDHAPA